MKTGITTPNYQSLSNKNKGSVTTTSEIKIAQLPTNITIEPNTSERQEVEDVDLETTYIVQSGDTLSKIAQENNLTYQELAEYNGIADPNKIEIGQVITIPSNLEESTTVQEENSQSTAQETTDVSYIVQSGDTLSKIAQENNLTYQELAEYNGIENPNILNVGQEIKIPGNLEDLSNSKDTEVSTSTEIKTNTNKDTDLSTTKETTDTESPTSVKTSNKDIDLSSIKEGSRVAEAVEKYGDEVENADYATISENLFATSSTDYINGQEVEVTHVVINDPSQINGSPANGSYASGTETATSAAARLGSSILINGSHFLGDGSQDLSGANHVVIVNGEIKTDKASGGQELLLDSEGKIYNASGKSAQELVDAGVKYSFSCHSTQVIVEGDTSPSRLETRKYMRTVIGMTEPCEYYIVTDKTANNALSDTAEYLKAKGCTNAYSLDQGGSVSLVRNTDLINNPRDGEERAVGDFLYFTA